MGSHSLLQRIFLTQELDQGLLHCRWILYQLSNKGIPKEETQTTSNHTGGLIQRGKLKHFKNIQMSKSVKRLNPKLEFLGSILLEKLVCAHIKSLHL